METEIQDTSTSKTNLKATSTVAFIVNEGRLMAL